MFDADSLHLGAAALAGAIVAGGWCRWRAARALAAVQARLQLSELARHAMQQRSDQARLQIGQLTKALADANRPARQLHTVVLPPPPEPVATPERSSDPLLQRSGPPEAFPDTQLVVGKDSR